MRIPTGCLHWLWKAPVLAAAASALLVLALRWLPVPTTSFILQAQWRALWADAPGPALAKDWVAWSQLSPALAQAAIAAEDQRFYAHQGFDFAALERAWKHNRRGKKIRGGSTISQQVAKNLFLWPGRSYVRKGLEAWFTVLIEALWPKRRILEVYLNIAEFGPMTYGAEAAAQRFFGKPARQLSRSQAALLAAVLPSPRRWSAARPSVFVRMRAARIQAQMAPLPNTDRPAAMP